MSNQVPPASPVRSIFRGLVGLGALLVLVVIVLAIAAVVTPHANPTPTATSQLRSTVATETGSTTLTAKTKTLTAEEIRVTEQSVDQLVEQEKAQFPKLLERAVDKLKTEALNEGAEGFGHAESVQKMVFVFQ